MSENAPVQPVDKPIICSPYIEPHDHWLYDRETGIANRAGFRRPAGYWYKTDKVGESQQRLFLEEERDDLVLVNRLREDVRRWREADYRGASNVTKDLLRYWAREDRGRRLFFCQREAVETIIYLAELRFPDLRRKGRSKTGFERFEVDDDDLRNMLKGEKPGFDLSQTTVFPSLVDQAFDDGMTPLNRLGCKMATGAGKTVVMAMLISWAFCNRARNPESREFPNAVLVCCPNLTVKERLQVLRPEIDANYYDEFDMLPSGKYREYLKSGKVLVTNWHAFAQPDREGQEGYTGVRNRGPETAQDMARRVLGEMFDRAPIMVLNDEGHHCWRPAPADDKLDADERQELEAEKQEATVWIEGLDRINNAFGSDKRGIALCVDLSATPFYIKGSGHPEGRPFPWLISDFGLVDAIECGITKIPRLPVQDTTGRPEPKYFKLWEAIRDSLQPAEFLPGRAKKPKPEVVWREAEDALQQLAGQWVERFQYLRDAKPGEELVPPVLIVVCDNTDVAEVFYRNISGEREEEIVTEEDIAEAAEGGGKRRRRMRKAKKEPHTVYGEGLVQPQYFSNRVGEPKRTIRIDTKLLAQAETEDGSGSRADAAEQLRQIVATVGKRGAPGEHVRCVVSVAMLTEGWDANNVTHILGLRAFGSQLLCEQVVGRGLRRMDYTPDPDTGLLTEEYVDVYGIPFSVIPFKGRPSTKSAPEDKPKHHVRAMEERPGMEMRFPVVEGYAFALRKGAIRCDVDAMEPLVIEPNHTPTATFVMPTVGYQEGSPSEHGGRFLFQEQNRDVYYQQTHPQAIQFQIARLIVDRLATHTDLERDAKRRVLRLQSRHQLFPQVLDFVRDYVGRKIDFQDAHPCELGLSKYVERLVERFGDAIEPDVSEGEPPILPVLNHHKPIGTTTEVNFKTTRPCHMTEKSHINQVVLDTHTWEKSAAFRLEQSRDVIYYARNDHLGLVIPYEYQGVDHSYEPDFLVRLSTGLTIVLEIKGFEDDQTRAKHNAAKRWVSATNNWGQIGKWHFHVCRNPQHLERELAAILSDARRAIAV